MKKDLQRIEAVLHQMTGQTQSDLAETVIMPAIAPNLGRIRSKQPNSPIQPVVAKVSLPSFPVLERPTAEPKPQSPALPPALETSAIALSPTVEDGLPTLPTITNPQFTTHRNVANPTLSMNLLKELERTVTNWQEELKRVSYQIQKLYAEGPIVDGWLESCAPMGDAPTPMFQHVDADNLLEVVEQAFATGNQAHQATEPVMKTMIKPTTGYRLCGLNEDGQLWFRECPPEQVIAVSLAIARYQKLQILTQRRQALETRLGNLAQSLITLHAQMQEAG